MSYRSESDSMGTVDVPSDRLWGAQTARSLVHFAIGDETLPPSIIKAFAVIKKAAALTNVELGLLSQDKADIIVRAADEIIAGEWHDHFPLKIWQTGSGTQSNMNVNEVIANRAIAHTGGVIGSKEPIHPNDHVNMSQSSNDTFPTAMHIAAVSELFATLIPAVTAMRDALNDKAEAFAAIIKIGRTHLMDAVPIALGQEFSGYVAQLDDDIRWVEQAGSDLFKLAIGGTAVGTGINSHPQFAGEVVKKIAEITGLPFTNAPNLFAALACHDPIVHTSGALKTLAVSLMKIAGDISWMGSGPRCGLSELFLPENEPGSSIMPGKVNPTQCEAMMMVAAQVMGNDHAIAIAGSRGNFELNVFKPMIIHNFLNSVKLLSETCRSFTEHLIKGLKPNVAKMEEYVARSLMLVTALSPTIGYDNAARAAHYAYKHNMTLKEACVKLGLIDSDSFDNAVDAAKMIRP